MSSSPEIKPRPNPVLSNDEESRIVDYINVCAQIGFRRTKQQVLSLVGDIVAKARRQPNSRIGNLGKTGGLGF